MVICKNLSEVISAAMCYGMNTGDGIDFFRRFVPCLRYGEGLSYHEIAVITTYDGVGGTAYMVGRGDEIWR